MLAHRHLRAPVPFLGRDVVDLGLAVHSGGVHERIRAGRRNGLAPKDEAAEVDARRCAHAAAAKLHGWPQAPLVGDGLVDLHFVRACGRVRRWRWQ